MTGDDFVWVHDYHLMLTAAAMRQAGVLAPMGFFLHTPFPGADIFEKLPWKKPILKALLEFDVIGFQSDHDRSNFVSCLERLLPQASIESGGTAVGSPPGIEAHRRWHISHRRRFRAICRTSRPSRD